MRGERIISVQLEACSPHAQRPLVSYSTSHRAGISYERRVTRVLLAQHNFYEQVVFKYKLKYEHGEKFAILDGLGWQMHEVQPCLTIYEIKHQLNEQAFKQVDFYMQLVAWWSKLPVRGVIYCCNVPEGLLMEECANISVATLSQRGLKRIEREARLRGDEHGLTRRAAKATGFVVRSSRGIGHAPTRTVHVSGLGE